VLRPSPRVSTWVRWGAAPVALALSAINVWQASFAAFSARTESPGNSWSTGNVTLTNDFEGRATFAETNLVPGSTGSKCVVVTSTSAVSTSVKFYTESLVDGGLAPNINMEITDGTGGGPGGSCTGFVSNASIYTGTLASLGATAISFATGHGTWTPPAGTNPRTYRFTWTVAETATQGSNAAIDFVWEAQSVVTS
jgi:hypothetical protein